MNYPYSRYDLRSNSPLKAPSKSTAILPFTQSSYPPDDTRVVELERRLAASELSHGNLLNEVVRLRQDLAMQLNRKDRHLTSDATVSRQLAETGLWSNNETLGQLTNQVQLLADQQRSDSGAIASLVNLIKSIENAMLTNQQDIEHKVDLCTARTNELREALNELRSSSTADNHQNRLSEQNLQQNLISLQNHVDRSLEKQRDSVGALEIRSQELEHKVERENIRIVGEITETTDELARKVLQKEIRQNEEWQAKLKSLQSVQDKLDTKWTSIGEKTMNELNRLVDGRKNTKRNLQRLNEAVNLLDQRLDEQKRIQDKFLAAEIQSRRQTEMETASKLTQIENALRQSKENLRQTTDKTTETWNVKMDASMTNVEEILPKVLRTVGKLEQDVQSRSNTNKKLEESISSLNNSINKLKADVTGLKQSHGILQGGVSSLNQSTGKLEKETQAVRLSTGKLEEDTISLKLSTRKLEKDTEAILISKRELLKRMSSLNLTIVKMEKDIAELQRSTVALENKVSEELNPNIGKLKEQMSQSVITSKPQSDINTIPSDKIYAIEEKHKSLEEELDRRLKEEAKNRETDIAEMKKRIKKLPDELKRTLPEDVIELQEGIRKVAETIQIVKTITGMKIQAEQQNRMRQCQELEENVSELRTEVHKMKGAKAAEDDDKEQ